MEPGGLYDADLAAIHAAGFSSTYADGFQWLVTQIDGPLFDLGCGDGTWLRFAAGHGVAGAGCDISPSFVEMARAHAMTVQLSDAQTVALPCDTSHVTALGEVLCYAAPAAPHPVKAALDHLCPHPALRWIAFDVIGPDMTDTRGTGGGADWRYDSITTVIGPALRRRITVTRNGRDSVTNHYQHLTDPDALRHWLSDHGFEADIGDSYGPAPLLPHRFRVIARRR